MLVIAKEFDVQQSKKPILQNNLHLNPMTLILKRPRYGQNVPPHHK